MRAIIICIILTTVFGLVALAQPPTETFALSIDPNPQNMFQTDKGYSVWSIGKYVYVLSGFVNDQNYRRNQVFMVDADTRQVVKEIAFEGPQGDLAITAYWVSSDQHILLTGGWYDFNAGLAMRTFLAKLTPDLETVWINYYPDLSTNDLYSEGITETEAGDYLFYLAEAHPPAPHNVSNLIVVKTDTSGTVLFSRMLVDTFNQRTYGYGDLTPTDDGNFLVTSMVRGYYYHPILGTYLHNAIVHKIDAEANQIWTKTLNYVKFLIQAPTSTSLAGGGGAVLSLKDTIVPNPEVAQNFPVMYGLDSEGNRTWTREWNKLGYQFVYRIKEAANSDILGVGFHYKVWPNKGKGWIFRTTNTGEPIWERHYSDSLLRPWSPRMELLDFCEMADGRIAATGLVADTNSLGSLNFNVILLVLDSLGCLEPGCAGQTQYVTSVLEPIHRLSLAFLGINPNPSSGPASIALPEALVSGRSRYELRCFSIDGRLVRREPWPPGASTLDITGWSLTDGMYHIILFEGNMPLATGKAIIQH